MKHRQVMDSSPAISFSPCGEPTFESQVFRVSRIELQQHAQVLPRVVRCMVALFGRDMTLEEVCEQLGIPQAKGVEVASKLTALGILDATGQQEDMGFSSLENAFFASAVPVIDLCDEPFETLSMKMRRLLSRVLSGGNR